MNKRSRLFALAGFLELVVGLFLSLLVGRTHSWNLAILLAIGFFMTANILFYLAMQSRS